MKTKQAYCVINGVSGLVSFISCHGQQLRLDSVLGFNKNARDFGNTILTGNWISHFPYGWTAFYEGSMATPHSLASRGLARNITDWKLNEHYSCEFYLFGPTEHAHFPEILMMGIQTAGHSHILQDYYYVDTVRQALAACPRLAQAPHPSAALPRAEVTGW